MASAKNHTRPKSRMRPARRETEDDPFLADVIATRDYESTTGVRVRIVIRRPEPAPEGDWRCAFEITGIDAPVRRRVFGIDGVQALAGAMLVLRASLESIGRDLTFLGGPPGDLGLPLIKTGDREELAVYDAALTLEQRRLEWVRARTTGTTRPRTRR